MNDELLKLAIGALVAMNTGLMGICAKHLFGKKSNGKTVTALPHDWECLQKERIATLEAESDGIRDIIATFRADIHTFSNAVQQLAIQVAKLEATFDRGRLA